MEVTESLLSSKASKPLSHVLCQWFYATFTTTTKQQDLGVQQHYPPEEQLKNVAFPYENIILIFKPQPWEAIEENILLLEGQQGKKTSGDK